MVPENNKNMFEEEEIFLHVACGPLDCFAYVFHECYLVVDKTLWNSLLFIKKFNLQVNGQMVFF